jgi:hypothetical protein
MPQRRFKKDNCTNSEVTVEARRREMVWIERQKFQGWACSECEWAFNPSGALIGESLDKMKSRYKEQRDNEFKSHVCADYPRTTKIPG